MGRKPKWKKTVALSLEPRNANKISALRTKKNKEEISALYRAIDEMLDDYFEHNTNPKKTYYVEKRKKLEEELDELKKLMEEKNVLISGYDTKIDEEEKKEEKK